MHHGLLLQPSFDLSIIDFSDAKWATDIEDRKFTTGFCIYLGTNLISLHSHKQKRPSSSTRLNTDVTDVFTEILWTQSLHVELHINGGIPKVYSNHLGAILLASDPARDAPQVQAFRNRPSRDHVQKHQIQLIHPNNESSSEIFTKLISGSSFAKIRKQ